MHALIAGLFISEVVLRVIPIQAASPVEPLPPTADMDSYILGTKKAGKPAGPPEATKPRPAQSNSSDSPLPYESCAPWILQGGSPICDVPASPKPGRRGSPAELAASAWKRLPIPLPNVRTAPPRGTQGLVGRPHWFWVTNGGPLSDRAEAGGVWVQLTARPQTLIIYPGHGQWPFRCTGTGTPYDPSRPAAWQRSKCSYIFARSSSGLPGGAFRVRVTAVWGGSWTGSGGVGGELPPLSRSVDFPVRVVEAQSLYR